MVRPEQVVVDGLRHPHYRQSHSGTSCSVMKFLRDEHGSIATDEPEAVDSSSYQRLSNRVEIGPRERVTTGAEPGAGLRRGRCVHNDRLSGAPSGECFSGPLQKPQIAAQQTGRAADYSQHFARSTSFEETPKAGVHHCRGRAELGDG